MTQVTFDEFARVCASSELPQVPQPDNSVVLVMVPGAHGAHLVVARLIEDRDTATCTVSLLSAGPDRREAVAAAAAHINSTILLGAFALDLADGELSFKIALPFVGVGLSEAQFGRCLGAIAWTVETYLPGFQRLCWSADVQLDDVLDLPRPSPLQAMLRAAETSNNDTAA